MNKKISIVRIAVALLIVALSMKAVQFYYETILWGSKSKDAIEKSIQLCKQLDLNCPGEPSLTREKGKEVFLFNDRIGVNFKEVQFVYSFNQGNLMSLRKAKNQTDIKRVEETSPFHIDKANEFLSVVGYADCAQLSSIEISVVQEQYRKCAIKSTNSAPRKDRTYMLRYFIMSDGKTGSSHTIGSLHLLIDPKSAEIMDFFAYTAHLDVDCAETGKSHDEGLSVDVLKQKADGYAQDWVRRKTDNDGALSIDNVFWEYDTTYRKHVAGFVYFYTNIQGDRYRDKTDLPKRDMCKLIYVILDSKTGELLEIS